jgi:hypothetical protein
MKPPRLTERQAAVLAAVKRLGSANAFDLRAAFPDLAQSELMRNGDRLVELGHLRVEGDPTRRYLGGVRYFPAGSRSSLAPELADLHRYLSETLQLTSWIAEGRIGVAMPQEEAERRLLGRSWCALDLVALSWIVEGWASLSYDEVPVRVASAEHSTQS